MKRLPWIVVVLAVVGASFITGTAQDYYKGLQTLVAGSGVSVPGLTGTSTAPLGGFQITNPTLATGGVPVQMSPPLAWCGHVWNTAADETSCFWMENLPATAATPTATLRLMYSRNGGAATTVFSWRNDGYTQVPTRLDAGTLLVASGGVYPSGTGRVSLSSSVDKLTTILDSVSATGVEFNGGSTTLGVCTGGAIAIGSHNFGGGYTGNTSSSCIVNFGAPNWTNVPFCSATSTASTTHPRISAASISSITITGGVSGEAINYHCDGRIGT